MRPLLAGETQPCQPSKSHPTSCDSTTPLAAPCNAPTSFFMATEADLDSRQQSHVPTDLAADSTYGVRSLEDAMAEADADAEEEEPGSINRRGKSRRRSTILAKNAMSRQESMESLRREPDTCSAGTSPPSIHMAERGIQLDALNQPLTPISFASPRLGSEILSSPPSLDGRSLRTSDEDELGDTSSQAVASSSDEADEEQQAIAEQNRSESVQLIMPSIMMPTRRPFTEKGKQLGRLKVLLAGASGTGKTSLIKSIIQTCEDIVHVDPPLSGTQHLQVSKASRTGSSGVRMRPPPRTVDEIHASTKSYPQWWSELEESVVVSRRRSAGENLLERNICFVDTPGYDGGTSVLEGMKPALDYIESQMAKCTMAGELKDTEVLSMLSGNGGIQVDVVFYLISHDLKPADVEYLRQLSHLAPTIPLISKCDTLASSSLPELKPAILEQLSSADVVPYTLPGSSISLPYATCSSLSNDLESMDASLLMQADFHSPLMASDLSTLVSDLFEPISVSALKHASARKLLRWRSNPRASPFPSPLSTNLSPGLSPVMSSPPLSSSWSLTTNQHNFSPLTHPRLAAHTQREERLANIRLANWAGALQRSLAAERTRYEDLARQERTTWLKEKLAHCADIDLDPDRHELEGDCAALVAVHESGSMRRQSKNDNNIVAAWRRRHSSQLDATDPLGLMRFADGMQRKGWIALRIIGGASLVGAVAFFMAKMSGMTEAICDMDNLRGWWEHCGISGWSGE